MKRHWIKFSTFAIHSSVLLFLSCLMCEDAPLYFDIEKCQSTDRPGNWCEWSAWSECKRVSCTRDRVRYCSCPEPALWGDNSDCESVIPQKDQGEAFHMRHSRYIRHTIHGRRCDIPGFFMGSYHTDCFRRWPTAIGTEHIDLKYPIICTYNGGFEACLGTNIDNNTRITVMGQIEYDAGACGGWRQDSFRTSVHDPSTHLTYSADTNLGRRCTFSKGDDDGYKCTPYYFFSETTEADYGRLTNLAFKSENCKFACAIHLNCRAIEFVQDFSCTLILGSVTVSDEVVFGAKIEYKPDECLGHTPTEYPYRRYMFLFEQV